MAIGNMEFMHECFPEHLCMGTARMRKKYHSKKKKQKKEVRRDIICKEVKQAQKKRSPDGLSLPNQNNSNKHNIVLIYKT